MEKRFKVKVAREEGCDLEFMLTEDEISKIQLICADTENVKYVEIRCMENEAKTPLIMSKKDFDDLEVGHWVSVDLELPPAENWVLTFDEEIGQMVGMNCLGVWTFDAQTSYKITHWAKLPEDPE